MSARTASTTDLAVAHSVTLEYTACWSDDVAIVTGFSSAFLLVQPIRTCSNNT